ncbi:MAG: HAD family hydrolase [Alistipes sp.]|nr:HAD family hydrolase [Alistipes sp.]
MQRYESLFFDLDGTLTDPMEGITRSVQYALRRFGIEVTDLKSLCPFIGPPFIESYREHYGFDEARAREAIAFSREYFTERGIFENRLYEGIPELLASLVAAGRRLYVATSKPRVFAERILDHFDIARHFTLVGGTGLDGSLPSKADVIADVIARSGISDLGSVVMIGDRKHDIIGARSVGIASLGVLYGYGSREELEAAGAGRIAADVEELREMLLG